MLARLGCIAGFVAVIAAPAMAENVSVNRVAGLDAPKLSETEQEKPLSMLHNKQSDRLRED
ncbi:MAG: hypothetical protein AAFQ85_08415 [Pseudomonadota bacterium]